MTTGYPFLRLAQYGDGARALARFDVQKHKAHKMPNPVELGTLKRRERRAPILGRDLQVASTVFCGW
jgi:hypothetical protein